MHRFTHSKVTKKPTERKKRHSTFCYVHTWEQTTRIKHQTAKE